MQVADAKGTCEIQGALKMMALKICDSNAYCLDKY